MVFGNGNKGDIIDIDKVDKSDSYIIKNLHNVRCLKHNLLSVSQICDKENRVQFTSGNCMITNKIFGNLVLKGKCTKIFTKLMSCLHLKMNGHVLV